MVIGVVVQIGDEVVAGEGVGVGKSKKSSFKGMKVETGEDTFRVDVVRGGFKTNGTKVAVVSSVLF